MDSCNCEITASPLAASLLIDGAQRPQRALCFRCDLRMRVAQNIDPLLQLLFDLPGGSFAVLASCSDGSPGASLRGTRPFFSLPARAGRRQVGFEKTAPANFADGGRCGDLLSQPSCRLIHLREARLGIRGALVHLFLPAPDFFRRRLSRRTSPQLIHDRPDFVLIRPHASAQAFQFLNGRLKLGLNLLFEIRAPGAFHFGELGINLLPGLR